MGGTVSTAESALPVCDEMYIGQVEEIDETGALVLEIRLNLLEDPAVPEKCYAVPASTFRADICFPKKHGGLSEPFRVNWLREQLLFFPSSDHSMLSCQAPCKAELPVGADPSAMKWANACIEVWCPHDGDLHFVISYLSASSRRTKSNSLPLSTEETAAMLTAYYGATRRMKRLVCFTQSQSNLRDFVHWCAEVAAECNTLALSFLLTCIARKITIPELNLHAMAAKLRLGSEAGDIDMQYLLSQILFIGVGVEKDEGEAIKWVMRAAERGHTKAQLVYGRSLLIGRHGLQKDTELGMVWLRRASDTGDSDAQTLLGLCYTAKQFPQELEHLEAVRLFSLAAASGNTTAQCKLAHCMLSGRGIDQDEDKALALYRKAGDAGNSEAQCSLGVAFVARGENVEAAKWLRAAADQGNLEAEAQYAALTAGSSCTVS